MPINYDVEYPKLQRTVSELREEVEQLRHRHKRDLAEYNRVAGDLTRLVGRLRFLCSSDLRTHTDTDLDDDVSELQELAWRLLDRAHLLKEVERLRNEAFGNEYAADGLGRLMDEWRVRAEAAEQEVERLRSKLTTQEIAEGRAADLEYEPPDTLDQQGWDVLDKALAEAQQGRPVEEDGDA